ncbi:MAG: PilZ domain-containing protein [Gammaproteobacteria bacterium]|nr:PilZ domain-containing protein [Gammaproteobacteria bacterium]
MGDRDRGRIRTQLFIYLEVLDQRTKQVIGHLGDISDGGLMIIIANQPLRLHQPKHISIKLPEDENFDKEYLNAWVEPRWIKPDVNPELHCVGCQFLEIEPEDQALIWEIGELLGFGDT